MPKKNKPIMCYGNEDDRAKAQFLAQQSGLSVSSYLLQFIRESYRNADNKPSDPDKTN